MRISGKYQSYSKFKPQKFNMDTKKWPYLKGGRLFQTIMLGIHLSSRGV